MLHNPNCDGGHCCTETGEVRVLPLPGGANLILCMTCYAREMQWRKERNRELSTDAQYDRPVWSDLTIYDVTRQACGGM